MESDMISPKLALALRKNRGKHLCPKFIDELSQSLGRPEESIRLLDLLHTDTLRQAFRNELNLRRAGSKPIYVGRWPAEQAEGVIRILCQIKLHMQDQPMVLFRALSDYCGAVESSSSEILANAFRLVTLDQEDLITVSQNLTYGLMLEYYTDYSTTGTNEVYTLSIWGVDALDQLSLPNL